MATQPAVVIRADDGSTIRVESFPLILGRSVPGSTLQPDCDLASLDTEGRISRQHAAVDWKDGHMVVTDLGSTNGTVLDGRTLTPHQPVPLAPRSNLVLGQVALVIEVEAPEAAPATATATATMIDRPPTSRRDGGGGQPPPGTQPAAAAIEPPVVPGGGAVAPAELYDWVFKALEDPGVSRLVVEPHRRLRLRGDGEWVQAGDAEVSTEAWAAFWTSFCDSAHVHPDAGGHVAVLLGDRILAEAFLPPLSVSPLFIAEKRPLPLGLDGMVAEGLIEVSTVGTLRSMLRSHQGMLLAGPARSGRTAFLEALVDSVTRGERIALVERRPCLRVSSPEAVRLRSAQGMGEAAVTTAMVAAPDWIVVDDADPEAVAAAAWRHSAGGPTPLMSARTPDLAAWKARAAGALAAQAGSADRAAALIEAAFPITVRLAPGPDVFVVQGVDKA